MRIGGHGHHHRWIPSPPRRREKEIKLTRAFVLNDRSDRWSLAYPYGELPMPEALEMMSKMRRRFALTSEVGTNSDLRNRHELRRLDPNDLPFTADAPVCSRTRLVAQ